MVSSALLVVILKTNEIVVTTGRKIHMENGRFTDDMPYCSVKQIAKH